MTPLTVASMCFAPLFCLASHSGYIIVAWLSDSQHAGPATFFYIISFLYCFIILRQLYKFCNSKLQKVGHHKKACFCLFILIFLFGGILLVGAEIFVICSLTVIPIIVTTTPTVGSLASFPGQTWSGNEANVFHLAFLIITGFFTYKLIYAEDEPKQFMNTFVKYLRKKGLDLKDLQDAEAAGEIIGEVAYTMLSHIERMTVAIGKRMLCQCFKLANILTSFAHHSDNIRTGAHYFELSPSRWVTALLDVVLYMDTTSYTTHKLAYHIQQNLPILQQNALSLPHPSSLYVNC